MVESLLWIIVLFKQNEKNSISSRNGNLLVTFFTELTAVNKLKQTQFRCS